MNGVPAAAVLLLLAVASGARAGTPTEDLRALVGRVLATFNDPSTRGPEHRPERQAAIREAMDAAIDFAEVSHRALGATWEARTPDERQQFVTAFSEFLKHVYLGQLDRYDDQKVLYDGESLDGSVATVMARIESKEGASTPFVFKLIQGADGRWRIYDIVLDGMSLIETYHAQFTAVLRRESFDALVQRIRARGHRVGAPSRSFE